MSGQYVYIPASEVGDGDGGPWMTHSDNPQGSVLIVGNLLITGDPMAPAFVLGEDGYWRNEDGGEVLGADKWRTLIIEHDGDAQ